MHWKTQLQSGWSLSDYAKVRNKLVALTKALEKEKRAAANSLREGLEEILTLHGVTMTEFAWGFSTTNSIENVNSLIKKDAGQR